MRQLSVSPRFPHFPACLQGPLLNIPSNCPPPPSFLPLGALGSKNLSATLSSCLFSCCASRLLLMCTFVYCLAPCILGLCQPSPC